jgi:hypothetical protein
MYRHQYTAKVEMIWIAAGAESGGYRVACPARVSRNAWIVREAAQLTKEAEVVWDLARNFQMFGVPVKVAVKLKLRRSSVRRTAET